MPRAPTWDKFMPLINRHLAHFGPSRVSHRGTGTINSFSFPFYILFYFFEEAKHVQTKGKLFRSLGKISFHLWVGRASGVRRGQLLERHERVKTFVEGKRRKRPETHISTGNWKLFLMTEITVKNIYIHSIRLKIKRALPVSRPVPPQPPPDFRNLLPQQIAIESIWGFSSGKDDLWKCN